MESHSKSQLLKFLAVFKPIETDTARCGIVIVSLHSAFPSGMFCPTFAHIVFALTRKRNTAFRVAKLTRRVRMLIKICQRNSVKYFAWVYLLISSLSDIERVCNLTIFEFPFGNCTFTRKLLVVFNRKCPIIPQIVVSIQEKGTYLPFKVATFTSTITFSPKNDHAITFQNLIAF